MVHVQTIRQRKRLNMALRDRRRQRAGDHLVGVVVVLVGIAIVAGIVWYMVHPKRT